MYTVLDKDTIEIEIVPLIPKTQRGFPPTVPLVEIVNAILYKLNPDYALELCDEP